MPTVQEAVTTTETKTVVVAKDSAGGDIRIGDSVTLTLKVTNVYEFPGDPSRDIAAKDMLSVGFERPSGYVLHFGSVDAALTKKV